MKCTILPRVRKIFKHFSAHFIIKIGKMAEWLKAADCKSAHVSVRWFEPSPAQVLT